VKIAAYYIILFLVVFIVTLAASSAASGRAADQDRVLLTPWQDYDGLIRV